MISRALVLVVLFSPSLALAQAECAEGRERSAEGRCCWPGQAYSIERGRCEGVPTCPSGTVEHGDDCHAPTLPALPPPSLSVPGLVTEDTATPSGYALAVPSTAPGTAGWARLDDLAVAAELRRPIQSSGEDEPLIAFSLAIFDAGWLLGLMVPLLDDTTGSCRSSWDGARTSCGSWPLAFIPVVGGLMSGLTSFGAYRLSGVYGAIHGSISLVLQVAGIIATAISFSNQTTEFALEPIVEDGSLTVELSLDAPESDAGASMVMRF